MENIMQNDDHYSLTLRQLHMDRDGVVLGIIRKN